MHRSRIVPVFLGLALAWLVGPYGTGFAAKPDPSAGRKGSKDFRHEPVARWSGGGVVTASQLIEHAVSRAGTAMRHGNEITPEGFRLLLDELVGQKLLLQQAKEKQVLADPRVARSYAMASAYKISDRYVREVLAKKFAPTDEEVAAALPKRRDVVRVKQIIVPTPEEAEEVLKKLRGGMSFDEAEEKHSIVKVVSGTTVEIRDDSDHFDEAIRRQLLELPQGQLSPALPVKIGYGIYLALERREIGEDEWNALRDARRKTLFEKKAGEHSQALMKELRVEVSTRELMLAAAEDYEFEPSHRPVLSLGGEVFYFDDYARTRDIHLRDTLKVKNAQDLYAGYKVQFENLGVALTLARAAAAEKGWTEPEEEAGEKLRDNIALKVLGEKLFDGLKVGDEEVRKEYRDHREAFVVKKRFKVRRVTFPTREAANEFRKSVKSPEDFYGRLRGAETKEDRYENTFEEWLNYDRLDALRKKAFDKARKGKLTEVVTFGEKKHVVYFVDDLKKNYQVPFEEARLNIKRTLLRQKQQKKLAEFVDAEKRSRKLEIFDAPIEQALATVNRSRKSHSGPGSAHGKPDTGGSR